MILPDAHRHGAAQPGTWAFLVCRPEDAASEVAHAVGLHPWHLDGDLAARLALLEKRLQHPAAAALGELGLDRACAVPWERQLAAFEAQVDLGRRFRKPLVLHVVRAFPEVISRRREGDPPGMVHGFRGGPELAVECLRHRLVPSFGFALLDSPKMQKTFRELPSGALLLETDESARSLAELYAFAADLRQITVPELAAQVAGTLRHLGIPVPQTLSSPSFI